MKLLISILLIISVNASAGELWLTSGEWSRHTSDTNCPWPGATCEPRYRQNNSGIGLQYDIDSDRSLVIGYYHNSIHRETVYAGGTYTPYHVMGFDLGAVGFIATGYNEKFPFVPLAALAATTKYERVGINIVWLPSVVVAVQLKVSLW